MLLSTGLTGRGTGMGNMSVSWGTVKTMVRVMSPDNAPACLVSIATSGISHCV